MKLGVSLPNVGTALGFRAAVLPVIDAAERLGFSSVWTTDHVVVPPAQTDQYGHVLESLTTLAVAAGRTERVELGTSVVILPQREPFLLAKQVASLHHLSGGRLLLGVGVGWLEEEFRLLGADFPNRGAVTDETVQALRAIWSTDRPRFAGAHIAFDDAVTSPVDPDLPPIPILIGGGTRLALRRAARLGDGWHAIRESVETLAEKLRYLDDLTDHRPSVSLRGRIAPDREVSDPDTRETSFWGDRSRMLDRAHRLADLGVEHLVVDPDTTDLTRFLEDLEWIADRLLPDVLALGTTRRV